MGDDLESVYFLRMIKAVPEFAYKLANSLHHDEKEVFGLRLRFNLMNFYRKGIT